MSTVGHSTILALVGLFIVGAALAVGPAALPAMADEAVPLDLADYYNYDLLGTVEEIAAANAYGAAHPTLNYTLRDVFGHHDLLAGVGTNRCYYVHNQYGFPTSGRIVTTYGLYQLGPAAAPPLTNYQPSPNVVTFGKWAGQPSQPLLVTLPAAQQRRYQTVNFLLVDWYYSTPGMDLWSTTIRLTATYQTGAPQLLYEGPVRHWAATATETFAPAFAALRYVNSGPVDARQAPQIYPGPRILWEFRTPRAVDGNRVLTGFTLEVVTDLPQVEAQVALLAASGLPAADPVLPAPLAVAVAQDADWSYQNTALTTADRHRVLLTLAVQQPDPNGPQGYAATVEEVDAAGRVTIVPTADPLVWQVLGGRRGGPTGLATLRITVRGLGAGGQGEASAAVNVRKLGDIDNNNSVDGQDKLCINKGLNGIRGSLSSRDLDLIGLGSVDGQSKLLINKILNGHVVP